MQPQNRTRISAQGLLTPRHRLSPLQQQSPTLSKLQQLTTASLSSHPLYPFSSWSPPEHSCHLVHPPTSKALACCYLSTCPLWCCCCHFLPTCTLMASPFSTLQLQAQSVWYETAGMSNTSCFPDPAGSGTRS